VNAASPAERQEAARLFRNYLTGIEGQQQAVASGLRPVTAGVPVTAPLDEAHGIDLDQPGIVFEPPSADSLFAIQELWATARKDLNLVMVLDTSGSMQGSKIENVKQAAAQFVEQMGGEDYLSLIIFSNTALIRFEHVQVGPNRQSILGDIRAMVASGSTPLYDAIGQSADILARTSSSQTTNAMVILTDGLDTSSSQYHFDDALISAAAANGTTIFTIAYGSDADEDLLALLASKANGSFFLGNEANISEIYAQMSTAFGGSLGIGR
jgi:Ca-activated chloride channel family protein